MYVYRLGLRRELIPYCRRDKKMTLNFFFLVNLFFMQLFHVSNGSSVNMVREGLTLQAAWKQISQLCPQLITKATKANHMSKVSLRMAPIHQILDPKHNSYLKLAGIPTQAEIDEKVADFCNLEEFEIRKLRDGEVKKLSDELPELYSDELSSDGALPELSSDDDLNDRDKEKFSFDSNSVFSCILFLFGLVCGLLVASFYFTRFPLWEISKTKMNLRRPEL